MRTEKEIEATLANLAGSAQTAAELQQAILNMEAGEAENIPDFIAALCRAKGIDPTASELVAYTSPSADVKAREAAAAHRADQEKTAFELKEKTAHYATELARGVSPTDQDMIAFAGDIARTAAALTAPAQKPTRERFATYADLLGDLRKYDPEHDFTTSLFAGLRCPNGSLNIIAARPGGGKTSAMINAAREVLKTNRTAIFINLEMNRRQIFTNLALSIMYDIADEDARRNLVTIPRTIEQFNRSFKYANPDAPYPKEQYFADLQLKAMKQLESAMNEQRLLIYDGIGNGLERITADIKSHAKEGDVVLLDYMQRTPPPVQAQSQNRQVQIQQASSAILAMAIEAQCVVIAGAQIGRDKERTLREATQADMRESGDIEQDAHNIIAIEPTPETKAGYVHVLKEREGGASMPRMKIESVPYYVYWAGTEEAYKLKDMQAKTTKKAELTQEEQEDAIRQRMGIKK